jgi:heme-degrading monooxygenase HmoA
MTPTDSVVRIWRGRALEKDADAYTAHVSGTVFPKLEAMSGFIGGRVLQRRVAEIVEFVVITEWASWDAIRAFAGEPLDAAVVEPEARALLVDFSNRVEHFEVVHETR